jgi:hypothetical protein
VSGGMLRIDHEYLTDLQGRLSTLFQQLSSGYDDVAKVRHSADTATLGDGTLAAACDDYLLALGGAIRVCGQLAEAMAEATADTGSTFQQIDDRLTDFLGPDGPPIEPPLDGPAEGIFETAFDNVFPPGSRHGAWKRSGGGYHGRHRRGGGFLFGRRG